MNRSTIDLWVGVFVVAGIAGLLFLALKVGNLASFSTSQTYQVQAKLMVLNKSGAPLTRISAWKKRGIFEVKAQPTARSD